MVLDERTRITDISLMTVLPLIGGTAMYRPCGSGFLRWTLWSSRRAKQVAGSTVMETLTVCLALAGSEPVTCGVYRGRGGDR